MTARERLCPSTKTRMVLVISDAKYFQDYTHDRGDEFVNDHGHGKVSCHPGYVVMSCDAFSNLVLNSWDRCSVVTTYWRIASAQALRGIHGPAEVVWQEGYKPRKSEEVIELLKSIEGERKAV